MLTKASVVAGVLLYPWSLSMLMIHALWSSSLLRMLLLLLLPSLVLAVFLRRKIIARQKSESSNPARYKRISIALLVSVFNRFAVRVCMIDVGALQNTITS